MSETIAISSPSFLEDAWPPTEDNVISTKSYGRDTRARVIAPKPPCSGTTRDKERPKSKQSKSRNGCTTCKTKRLKCDETKPSCQQCSRRRIVCGGYRQDLRWKPFGKPKPTKSKSNNTISGRHSNVARLPSSPSPSAADTPCTFDQNETELCEATQLTEFPWDISQCDPTDLAYLDFLSSHSNIDTGEYQFFESETLEGYSGPSLDMGTGDVAHDITELISHQESRTLLTGVTPSRSESIDVQAKPPLFKVPWFQSIGAELIEGLFEQETCGILSITDGPDRNPWRTLIWPLARNDAALYHAIAAMTCLHLSRKQPHLRLEGIAHREQALQALATNVEDGSFQIEAAIAALLALGFADQWDYQKSSTGIEHIRAAKVLIDRVHSTHQTAGLTPERLRPLTFLAKTWIYMDVIARLTSVNDDEIDRTELITVNSQLSLDSDDQQMDPLMGYAASLFPMISRVADLVARVRRRSAKRNSPSIISEATALKKEIEGWYLPVDLQSTKDVTYNMSDSVQTAEAYRWATLLLLRQAVPELPSLFSWGDLAHKVLIFLATVPTSSPSTIVQTFPLMVAGCEAVEEEDREWVTARWQSMSSRMITGIVDRCREITIEVWRRRDEREAGFELSHKSENLPLSGSPTRWAASTFPDSAAFKKGVDQFTRAGCIDYTVKGRLHWLGVMKEWNWEVMLG